ncbi:carbohydrate ABC transporter permease [Salipaludibacillus aurantiacus]|uniref:Raffinose/stachyose/melibiose transport system permease protein n=1 Tax=Salipaludibacillus aurantiacus TaxID=1601833 RepID=A0A1H9UER5_9BACI|nr:carbohydrate ABC transporter permease [Salipaludibacillus aurantiacus]SES07751.1 raffinose/stachyose/melibiose transport system permease protein [Salipaludibacillus aurantiacus]
MSSKVNWKATILLILGTVFILFPLYLTITIAFKTPQEMTGNLLALPETWTFDNFFRAIEVTNFFNALGNSVFVTVFTVAIVVLTHSMVAYAIARNMHKKFYKFLYFYFISAMFIPFPIIMLPLVLQTSAWGMDNLVGLGFLNGVMHLAFNVFIYVGYVKTLPVELEEAAHIDGAGTWKVFWKIIFPMMMPMHATVAILTALAAWNDFMLPLVILSDSSMYTLPLVQYAFQGQFSTDYNLAFASYLMAMLPMIVLYIFVQKWIIGGVMRGSLK